MKKHDFWLYFTALMAALGGLLSGYDTGVISGALLFINQSWNLSVSQQGLLVSSVLIGALTGAATTGVFADIFGRKKIIIATAIMFFAGSIFCALSTDVEFLIFARIFTGFAVGAVNFATPLYLSEVSPKEKRGMFVSLFQLAITAGILFSYGINAVFANFEHSWRLMLLAGVIPAGVLMCGMFFLYDTPRWLVLKGKEKDAALAFKKIQGDIDVDYEISEIKKSFISQDGAKFKINSLFKKWLIMPFVVGIGIMFAQICTGVNTIIYYAPTIFKLAGFDSNQSAIYATGLIGVVNFLMTFVAIAYSDKLGRKPLLYIGLSGIMLSLIVMGSVFAFSLQLGDYVKWFAVGSLILYIICFAFSLGPVGMTLISEVFPLKVRGVAMSICMFSNFVFNFIITYSFPIMLNKIGAAYTFWFFVLICIICLFFVYRFVPETKGIALEKIEENWKNGVKARDF